MLSSVYRTACPPILLVLLVVVTLALSGIPKVEAVTSTAGEAAAADLERLWDIDYPEVTLIQESNTLVIDYGMSPELNGDVNVRTKIYQDYNCIGPALTEGILVDEVKPATGEHIIKLDIQTLIHNPMISTVDYEDDHGMMKFCLYYSLWSGTEEDDIEINSLYNLLRIYLSMDRGIEIDGFLVTESPDDDDYNNGDRHKHMEKEKHYLDVYLCHPVTHERTSEPVGGYGLGDVLSICCAASQSILDDGIFLQGVENFLWRKTVYKGAVSYVTEQWAVKDGVTDAVSTYHCPNFALLCTFTTMLKAEFFMSEGVVTGMGSATLGFGMRKLDAPRDDDTIIPDEKISITIRTPQGITVIPKTRFLRALAEKPNEDNSNMSILIPIKGPGKRPEMMISSGNSNNKGRWGNGLLVSTGTLWWLILMFLAIFAIGAYLAYREWKLEKSGEKGDASYRQK